MQKTKQADARGKQFFRVWLSFRTSLTLGEPSLIILDPGFLAELNPISVGQPHHAVPYCVVDLGQVRMMGEESAWEAGSGPGPLPALPVFCDSLDP